MSKLQRELAAVGRLPHDKNDFVSAPYPLGAYPEVERSIVEQAAAVGFELPGVGARDLPVRARHFELQTHSRSVEEHTDDVGRGRVWFGLLPVRSRQVVGGPYSTDTWLHFRLGRQRLRRRMQVGSLIVFNPLAPHSLVYYGEETTFALLALVRARRGLARAARLG